MSAQSPSNPAAIVPFWNRLRQVILYPAHGGAMVTIVLLGAAQVLRILPLGWILGLLAAVAMYRYAFECLQATADGFMEPPEVSLGTDRSLGRKFVWLMIILALVAIVGAAMLGPGLGLILAIVLAVCMPGATMTLAMEQSLSEALVPTKWFAIIAAIGWPYLALVGVCAVIFMSEIYAQAFVAHILPLPLALIVLGIISNYAVTALFHLMGYALYQYHKELGLTPVAQQMERSSAQADPGQAKLDEAGALVRDGKIEEATELLRAQIRRGATPATQAQYRKLLRAADNKAGLLEHGRDFIVQLIDADDERGAVELLRECQAIDPAFAPATAVQVAKLAYMAWRQHQPQAAFLLVKDFDQRFPKSQYISQCGLLAVDVLHEHMGRDEEACVLLRHLQETVPGDSLRPEIDAKLAAIERMIAATAKKSAPAQPSGAGQA